MSHIMGTRLKEDGIFVVEMLRVHRLQENRGERVSVFEFVRGGCLEYVILPWMPSHERFLSRLLPYTCTLVSIWQHGAIHVRWSFDDLSEIAKLMEHPATGQTGKFKKSERNV